MPLPDLSSYAGLSQVFDKAFQEKHRKRSEAEPDYLHLVICSTDERSGGFRAEMDKLMLDGLATGIADADLLGRLKSASDVHFGSARAELEVNHFLKKRGFVLRPRPAGRGGRVGDLEVAVDPPVFVEVKAVNDREYEQVEERLSRKLHRLTERADAPSFFIKLEITAVARDFRGAAYRAWLQGVLETASVGSTFAYSDQSGMSVEVSVLSEPEDDSRGPMTMQMSAVRSLSNEEFFQASMTNAYAQLPDGRPTLIVLRSFLTFGNENYEIERAVLGSNSVVIPKIGEPYWSRQRDGFFWASPRDRVSAVALLNSKWTGDGPDSRAELSLDVYHNPFARIPLDWQLLRGPGIRHLLRVSDTEMTWHE